jgi:hypothetical protein
MLQSGFVKPRTYLHTLTNTFSSPLYYFHVLNANFNFSLRFFFVSYLLLTFLATAFFLTQDLPRYHRYIDQTMDQFAQQFPETAELNWDKETLSGNTTEPIEVKYPPFMKNEDLPPTFGYISTSSASATQVVTQTGKNSLFVVTASKVFISSPPNGWSDVSLKELLAPNQSFTLTKQTLPGFLSSWKTELHGLLDQIKYIYPFALLVFYLIARTITLFLDSLIIYYITQVSRKPLPLRKVFQVSLHVGVVAEFVQIITSRLFAHLTIPMFTVTYWVYMIIIMFTFFYIHRFFSTPKNSA